MKNCQLTVIIPVYNEEKTLPLVVEQILKAVPELKKEIIIVDDCSTDGTRDWLESKKDDKLFKIFFHEKNQGKTAAIRTAIDHVEGDIIIIQDADLEYPPLENYSVLLEPIIKGWADVVYGSRFLGTHRVFFFWHYFVNKFLTFLANVLFDTMLSDMETGAKAFHKNVLDRIKIKSQGFNFEPEFTAKVFKQGWRVFEVPITYCGRGYKEGKKIKPIDGLLAIVSLLKYRIVD